MEQKRLNLKSMIRFLMRTQGQDLVEYVLLIALIAFAATVGMKSMATKINLAFSNAGTTLTTYIT